MGIWIFLSCQMCVRCSLQASCRPLKNKFGPPSSRTSGDGVFPRVKRGEVLVDDRLKQGSDDFIDRHAGF